MGESCSSSCNGSASAQPKPIKKRQDNKEIVDQRIQEAIKKSLSDSDQPVSIDKVMESEFSNTKCELGFVRAARIANQFNEPVVEKLAEKHKTCKATCGYFCTAVARKLAVKDMSLQSGEEICCLIENLTHISELELFLDEAMTFTMKDRFTYCDKSTEIMTTTEREAYLRDWIANYEISDFIQNIPQTKFPIAFFRHNQTVDLPDAKHVERRVIMEEEVPLGESAPFFIEMFFPRRMFISSKNEFIEECATRCVDPKSVIWIVDLNGHFNVAIATPHLNKTDLLYLDSMNSCCCSNVASEALLELYM